MHRGLQVAVSTSVCIDVKRGGRGGGRVAVVFPRYLLQSHL